MLIVGYIKEVYKKSILTHFFFYLFLFGVEGKFFFPVVFFFWEMVLQLIHVAWRFV
jgi:hypothetical protein